MDRRRAFAALLIIATGSAAPLPIREARWIAPDARLTALSQNPATCLAVPQDDAAFAAIMTGMAAFRTPLLLGGQAARAGVSCDSCHRNGGGNPHFQFPGLSHSDGMADVTSSLLSSRRGDGKDNPRPIPDLAFDPPKVSRDPGSPALRRFVHGLIVEEFDGAEPPPAVLDALVAYVRALGAGDCRIVPAETMSARLHLGEVIGTVWLAKGALDGGDKPTGRLLLAAARTTLGRIHERYAGAELARERATLEALDDGLKAIRETANAAALPAWVAKAESAGPILVAAEPRSLYNRDRLAAALAP